MEGASGWNVPNVGGVVEDGLSIAEGTGGSEGSTGEKRTSDECLVLHGC